MQKDVTEAIYEAALLPELWPDALDLVRGRTRSVLGLMIGADAANAVTSITSPGGERIIEDYNALNLFSRSQRLPRAIAAQCHNFVRDSDLFTPEERLADPTYTEFFFPRGMGHGTATIIRFPGDYTVVFDFERLLSEGPFSDDTVAYLDGLRPHFGRAATLWHRMELRRARDRVDVLNAIGIAAMALDARGRCLAMNTAMEAFVPTVVMDRARGAGFADPEADRRWQAALSAGRDIALSLPVRREPFPIVAHRVPVVRRAQDLLSLTAALLIVMPVTTASTALPADVIQILFDLTPAEAKVAYALGGGASVADIARQQTLSEETIRTQVKAIMRKTGTSRQRDLITLVTQKLADPTPADR